MKRTGEKQVPNPFVPIHCHTIISVKRENEVMKGIYKRTKTGNFTELPERESLSPLGVG